MPTLFVDSDLVDPRYFSSAQIMNRIDTFFEALNRRKEAARRPGQGA
jgi:benzoyl-CoA reductase subunit B